MRKINPFWLIMECIALAMILLILAVLGGIMFSIVMFAAKIIYCALIAVSIVVIVVGYAYGRWSGRL